jgi:hypothetical protein
MGDCAHLRSPNTTVPQPLKRQRYLRLPGLIGFNGILPPVLTRRVGRIAK